MADVSEIHSSLITGNVKAVSATSIKIAPLSFRAVSWQSLSPVFSKSCCSRLAFLTTVLNADGHEASIPWGMGTPVLSASTLGFHIMFSLLKAWCRRHCLLSLGRHVW